MQQMISETIAPLPPLTASHAMATHLSQSLHQSNRNSAPNTPQSQPSVHHSVSSPMTPQQIYSPVGPQSQQSSPLSHSHSQPSTPLPPQQSPQQFIHVPSPQPQTQQPSSPAMTSKMSRMHSSMAQMANPSEAIAPQIGPPIAVVPPVPPPVHVSQTTSHRGHRSKSSNSSISKLQQMTNGLNQSLPQTAVPHSTQGFTQNNCFMQFLTFISIL